ncbi:hypothetical protein V8F06_012980 [Rhypophila decipiens]
MSTLRGWAYLEVHVTFPVINPPSDASVSIRFPEPEQAFWYHGYILSKPFHATNNLQSRRRENTVTVRLPSRFTKITASVRCEGFYFTVSDKRLADEWVANMLVWQLLPEYTLGPNQTQLAVVRNWSHSPTISPYLLACLPPAKGRQPPPIPPSGHALPPRQVPGPAPHVQDYRAVPAEIGGAVGSAAPRQPPQPQPPPPPPPLPPRDLGQAVGSRFQSREDGYQGQQGFNGQPQAPPYPVYSPY